MAGDEGGRKARRLIEGIVAGAVGTHFNLPMAGIGIVFIANIFAMASLGLGLIVRGYSQQFFGIDLGQTYIPHGFMIGAGLVSLIQAIAIIQQGSKNKSDVNQTKSATSQDYTRTVGPDQARRSMLVHLGLYL